MLIPFSLFPLWFSDSIISTEISSISCFFVCYLQYSSFQRLYYSFQNIFPFRYCIIQCEISTLLSQFLFLWRDSSMYSFIMRIFYFSYLSMVKITVKKNPHLLFPTFRSSWGWSLDAFSVKYESHSPVSLYL